MPRRVVLLVIAAVGVVGGLIAMAIVRDGDGDGRAEQPTPTTISTAHLDTTTTGPATTVTSSTVTSSAAPTANEPTSTSTGSSDCSESPIPPPSLVDGSTPGEASAGTHAGDIATWGAGSVSAVSQISAASEAVEFYADPAASAGDYTMRKGFESDTYLIGFEGPAGFCPRVYRVDDRYQHAIGRLGQQWLDHYATGASIVDELHEELTPPVDYYGWSSDGGAAERARFSPTGQNLGPVTIEDTTGNSIGLADGRAIVLGPFNFEPCSNRAANVVGPAGSSPLHPDLPVVSTLAATATGIVVAGRDVCPDGSVWGDPGTVWQAVRVDLAHPELPPTVLFERTPDQLDRSMGTKWINTISPDGRFIGVTEPIHLESWRWEIFDVTSPATPLELPTSCPAAGDVVAVPSFGVATVVTARACPSDTDPAGVVLDQMTLPDRDLTWSTILDTPGMLATYGNEVGLSVVHDDLPWIIVNGGDFEEQEVALLIHGDQEVDITHLGYSQLSFDPDGF